MKKIVQLTTVLLLMMGLNEVQAKDPVRPANQIGIYPFTVTTDGLGLGVFYERDVGSSDKASFVMPVRFLINSYENYDIYPGTGSSTDFRNFIEFAPGMKFYPINRDRVLTFALGPSLYYSYGAYEGYRDVGDYSQPIVREYFDRQVHSLGILANAYLDVTIAKQFVMGLQMGLGINYLTLEKDKMRNGVQTTRQEIFQPVGQFTLSFAYRF